MSRAARGTPRAVSLFGGNQATAIIGDYGFPGSRKVITPSVKIFAETGRK